MTRLIDRCVHCGEPDSAHHEFEAVIVTNTCRCDPTEWTDGTPLAICSKYTDPMSFGYCENCEHDRECHEVKK